MACPGTVDGLLCCHCVCVCVLFVFALDRVARQCTYVERTQVWRAGARVKPHACLNAGTRCTQARASTTSHTRTRTNTTTPNTAPGQANILHGRPTPCLLKTVPGNTSKHYADSETSLGGVGMTQTKRMLNHIKRNRNYECVVPPPCLTNCLLRIYPMSHDIPVPHQLVCVFHRFSGMCSTEFVWLFFKCIGVSSWCCSASLPSWENEVLMSHVLWSCCYNGCIYHCFLDRSELIREV